MDWHNWIEPYQAVKEEDYLAPCCAHPDWEGGMIGFVQKKDYPVPSASLKRRKYARMYFGCLIHEDIKNLLMEHGFATEQDFRKTRMLDGKPVGYQITPVHCVSGSQEIANLNE